MKEYLTKNSSGNYQLVNHYSGEDDILVPDGAEALTECMEYGELFRLWWKGEYKICVGYDDDWLNIKRDIEDYLSETKGSVIAWQRESLNDKVASAEVARQDNVNHPKHYTSDPSGIECIEVTRHRNFNIGNAIKYLWRNGLKDSDAQIQDLEKAIWYIQDEINRLSK